MCQVQGISQKSPGFDSAILVTIVGHHCISMADLLFSGIWFHRASKKKVIIPAWRNAACSCRLARILLSPDTTTPPPAFANRRTQCTSPRSELGRYLLELTTLTFFE